MMVRVMNALCSFPDRSASLGTAVGLARPSILEYAHITDDDGSANYLYIVLSNEIVMTSGDAPPLSYHIRRTSPPWRCDHNRHRSDAAVISFSCHCEIALVCDRHHDVIGSG